MIAWLRVVRDIVRSFSSDASWILGTSPGYSQKASFDGVELLRGYVIAAR